MAVRKNIAKPEAMEALGNLLTNAGQDTDEETDIPFPGDKRSLREQVNDHPLVVVRINIGVVVGDISETGMTQFYNAERSYDWFDTRKPADAWAKEVRSWSDKDAAEFGNCVYVVTVAKTGVEFTPVSVTAHGVSADVGTALCKAVLVDPEEHCFAATKAVNEAAKEAVKKKVVKAVKGVKAQEPVAAVDKAAVVRAKRPLIRVESPRPTVKVAEAGKAQGLRQRIKQNRVSA